MTGLLLNIVWFTVVFLFLAAVVGSIALARWRQREREDAAATEKVMDSLGFDHTNSHIYDA